MKVYTIYGLTGMYEDVKRWLVVSYLNKETAEKHTISANQKAKEWQLTRNNVDQQVPEGFNSYDRNMVMDENGTDYYCEESELTDFDIQVSLNFIKILLIDKRARFNVASRYILNRELQFECELLKAEIEALENEKQRLEAICSQAV